MSKHRRITAPEVARVNAVSSQQMLRVHDRIAIALSGANDARKEARVQAGECIACFYFDRGKLVGQAFTNWKCQACGVEGSHPNTGVPRYCKTCSDELNLCVECGGDREMRFRRKLVRVKRRSSR